MSDDDFLYDRSGAPDIDVEKLERVLRPLGRRDDAPIRPVTPRRRGRLVLVTLAAAAAAALLRVLLVPATEPAQPAVASGPAIRDAADSASFAAGDWVETADAGREILVGDLGRVTLAARSRLQVRHVSSETTRLYLARGSLEARVGADVRPRFFQVDTDAARCVDLGCRYTLDVAKDGVATVRVVTGQVAFETATREVFVPAGAVCVARRGSGPGTPRFEDARAALGDAFDALDGAASGTPARRRELAAAALDEVRDGRDTLPAWHLLQDADAEIVRAAASRLADVAGDCDVDVHATPAAIREAWRSRLQGRFW